MNEVFSVIQKVNLVEIFAHEVFAVLMMMMMMMMMMLRTGSSVSLQSAAVRLQWTLSGGRDDAAGRDEVQPRQ